MKTITISSFSNEAASKTKGELLKQYIETLINSNETEIFIDFTDIKRFASPFFNNSFASLALLYGFDTIEKIKLLNITETGLHAYETSLENAKLLSSSPDYTEQIDQIVNNAPKKAEEL